jgi:hypothetical protein
MTRQLVFVHGRSQEGKDAIALKAEWIEAFKEGLSKSNLSLQIAEEDIRFPYYGDTLYEMVKGASAEEAAAVVVRGTDLEEEECRFTRAVMQEMSAKIGITPAQLAEIGGQDVVERGPLNWEWFHTFLKAVDRFVPYCSGATIAMFTHDVYLYLKNSAIRQTIDAGVSAAMPRDIETVVVSHSLGTVVAYNLLRQQGKLAGWKVPLLITVGSPLAISEVRGTLRFMNPIRCPECVSAWFNALDERDVVALYPLDAKTFPLDPAAPAIENKRDVRNRTSNRHGIAGYLDDAVVARRIYQALTA